MKKTYLVAALLSTAVGSSAAYAEKPNTYVFLDGNYNNVSTDVTDSSSFDPVLLGNNDTPTDQWSVSATKPLFSEDKVSDGSNGFRIGAGMNFAPNWGIEVSYAMFGHATDTSRDATHGDLELTTRARTFTVDVARYFPITDQFRLYGKLGVDAWTVDIRADQAGKQADSDRDTGYMPMVGFGAQLDLADQWSVRAELSHRRYDANYRQYLLKDNPSAAAGELNTLGKYSDINTNVAITSFSLGIGRHF